jgi:hypothetical protein
MAPKKSIPAMKVLKKVGKKVQKKLKDSDGKPTPGTLANVMKKPSSALNGSKLSKLANMTLEEKIDYYNKKGHEGGIDSFLAQIGDKDRQCLWKQFEYSRKNDKLASEAYAKYGTGAGSDPAKKKMLEIFLKCGRDCKNQAYHQEVSKYTFSEGSRTTEEWVPFAHILKKFGLNEAMRRLKKGSILARKDPTDPDEWEFLDRKVQEFQQSNLEQSSAATKGSKLEAVDWVKLRGLGKSGFQGSSTELDVFINSQIGKGSKGKATSSLAIMDKEELPEDEKEDEEELEVNEDNQMMKFTQKAAALSVINAGSKVKVPQRLVDMLKVVNATKGYIECEAMDLIEKKKDPKLKKEFTAVVENLELVQKALKKNMSRSTLTAEQAKPVLIDAAQQLKKADSFVKKLKA